MRKVIAFIAVSTASNEWLRGGGDPTERRNKPCGMSREQG